MHVDCGPVHGCGVKARTSGDFCWDCEGCDYLLLGTISSASLCDDECVTMAATWCVYKRNSKHDGNCWGYTSRACLGKPGVNQPDATYTHWPTCVGVPCFLVPISRVLLCTSTCALDAVVEDPQKGCALCAGISCYLTSYHQLALTYMACVVFCRRGSTIVS